MIVSYVLGILGAPSVGLRAEDYTPISNAAVGPNSFFATESISNSSKFHLRPRIAQLPPHIPHNHAISFTLQLAWTPVLDIFQRPKFARPTSGIQMYWLRSPQSSHDTLIASIFP